MRKSLAAAPALVEMQMSLMCVQPWMLLQRGGQVAPKIKLTLVFTSSSSNLCTGVGPNHKVRKQPRLATELCVGLVAMPRRVF